MEHKTYYYSPGQIIFHQGDAGGFLYQVQSGSVEISCNYPHEIAVVIGNAGPGDFFGEMALIDNRPRMATATATSKTICTKIWPDEVATIIGHLDKVSQKDCHNLLQFIRDYRPYDVPVASGVGGRPDSAKIEELNSILKRIDSSKFPALVQNDSLALALFRCLISYARRQLPPSR
jgi:hypothetical protein